MAKPTPQPKVEHIAGSDAVVSTHEMPRAPHHRFLRIGVYVSGVLVLLLGALIGTSFLANKTVASIPIGKTDTPIELQERIEARVADYQLSVQYPNGETKTFSLPKVGISVDAAATAQAAVASQHPGLLKRLVWWRQADVPLVLSTNSKKLQNFIRTKATKIVKPAKNATIKITNGKVVVTNERVGTAYSMEDTEETLLAAVRQLRTDALHTKEEAKAPAITKADIDPVADKVSDMLKQKVVFKIESRAFTAASADIAKWIELTAVEDQKTVDIDVNSGKVLEYLDRIAAPYVQPPKSRVVLKTKAGATKIIDAGQSGLDITNKATLARSVADKLQKGQGSTVDAAITYAKSATVNAKSYPKWIVVDVTTKRMYAYENTRLVRTFLISSGAPATPTPLGSYKITYKVRKQDMRGDNVDGSRYFQPNVEWVNYFAPGGYAIHGNYWRPLSYFGNVNSSHGCVGIVNSDASWIYTWAPVGTPVIIHS